MSIHQLASTLAALRASLAGNFPRGATAVLLEIMAACLTLLLSLSQQLRASTDPRIAAAHAQLIESLFRYTLREQLHCAIQLESTGAHLLTDDDLRALRTGTTDFSRPAQQHTGRAHYLNTADFTANWLKLNPHEALTRVADAHLLIARRTMDGTTIAPRLAKLADLFLRDDELDPRLVARAVRTLDSFEPTDRCFQGEPLAPTARYEDGQLLEDHAVTLLAEPDRATRETLVNKFLSAERTARKSTKVPDCGLFWQGEVGERDIYKLVVGGSQREELRSHTAQSDNPRTDAGKSARTASSADSSAGTNPHADHARSTENTDNANTAQNNAAADTSKEGSPHDTDELFSSNEPMPPWAQDPHEQSRQEATHDSDQPLFDDEEQAHKVVNPHLGILGDAHVSVPQRRLNALIAALKNTAAGNTNKTVTPKVVIHINLESLTDLKNPDRLTSITEHGLKLGPADTSQLVCQGEIFRVIFGPNSQPLDVGRSQRFFTEAMKRAIFARDRGCIVPGCTAPVEMLEYHHNDWWENGGGTSVHNGSCLCRAHHHAVHAGLLKLVIVNSLAHIVLPKHLDPQQTPQRNRLNLVAS